MARQRGSSDANLHVAYSRLRHDLIKQKFQPGQRLVVADLAAAYDVSNTPVREALNRLHEAGFIHFERGRGFFVKLPSPDEIQALYELLAVLLKHAVRTAVDAGQKDAVLDVLESTRKAFTGNAQATCPREAGEQRADALETMIERLVRLNCADEVLHVVRNTLDRTHYVRCIDLESRTGVVDVCEAIIGLEDAVRDNDLAGCDASIERQITGKIQRVPSLVREGTGRYYAPY